jgi:hypothetical protein
MARTTLMFSRILADSGQTTLMLSRITLTFFRIGQQQLSLVNLSVPLRPPDLQCRRYIDQLFGSFGQGKTQNRGSTTT